MEHLVQIDYRFARPMIIQSIRLLSWYEFRFCRMYQHFVNELTISDFHKCNYRPLSGSWSTMPGTALILLSSVNSICQHIPSPIYYGK